MIFRVVETKYTRTLILIQSVLTWSRMQEMMDPTDGIILVGSDVHSNHLLPVRFELVDTIHLVDHLAQS